MTIQVNLNRRPHLKLDIQPNYSIVLFTIGLAALVLLVYIQNDIVYISKSQLKANGGPQYWGGLQFIAIQLRALYRQMPGFLHDRAWTIYASCIYFIAPFFLLFEYLFPNNRTQSVFSRGLLQDATWFGLRLLLVEPLLLIPFLGFIDAEFSNHLRFFDIKITSWPSFVLQLVFSIVLYDFLTWLSHVIVHKSAVLWKFHAVHHSQEQMNVFTDDRAHPVDLLFRSLISFVPFLIFNPTLPMIATVVVLRGAMQRFIHCNVRIDFGIFGYLFVSPQFHRVHHSVEHRHRDKNFGTLLSVWDYLFGTACSEIGACPVTGVDDLSFPYEGRSEKTQLISSIYNQLAYPFKQIFGERAIGKDAEDDERIHSESGVRASEGLSRL